MQTESTSRADARTRYRRTRLFAEIDRRTAGGYTRTGGLYRVDWSDYSQTNAGTSSFQRIDADVRQFIPVFRENWIIALRALASTTTTAPGQDVPFFLLPDLGGSHTLRGYRALALPRPQPAAAERRVSLDGGIVRGHGAVCRRRQGRRRASPTSICAASRPRTASAHRSTRRSARVTRIELARTREGNSLMFSFSPSF